MNKGPSPLDKIFEEAFPQWHQDSMWRGRPYDGQPHTCTGERGAEEVCGITFRDLRDAFMRAVCLSASHLSHPLYDQALKGEAALIRENDLHTLDLNQLDIIAVQQNLCVEVEKLMGIYPNLPELKMLDDD